MFLADSEQTGIIMAKNEKKVTCVNANSLLLLLVAYEVLVESLKKIHHLNTYQGGQLCT